MICKDCEEPIIESERKAARVCVSCKRSMHAECAMSDPSERDYCEQCLCGDEAAFHRHLRKMGARA